MILILNISDGLPTCEAIRICLIATEKSLFESLGDRKKVIRVTDIITGGIEGRHAEHNLTGPGLLGGWLGKTLDKLFQGLQFHC